MADMTNAGTGPGTVSIGGTTYHTEGGGLVAGIETDVPLLTPDALTVPTQGVVTMVVPYIKGESIETTATELAAFWNLDTPTGTPLAADIGDPTSKDTNAGVAVVFTTDTCVFDLTEGIATEYGELTAEKGAYVKCGFTFKGISSGGATAAGGVTDIAS